MDDQDLDLRRPTEEPLIAPPAKSPVPVRLIVALLIVVIGVGAYFIFRGSPSDAPDADGTDAVADAVPPGERAPLGAEPPTVILPPLDESDSFVRDLVAQLSSDPRFLAWLATDGLIRTFAVVVSNVAAGESPSRQLAMMRPLSGFRASERDGSLYVDQRSYERYTALADVAAGIDPQGAATLYATLKPRIEEAYGELGFPDTRFDETLERAIVVLLETPIMDDPALLEESGGTGYSFADPKIESLTAAQKQLLRCGPSNARVIRRALREIAMALGIPPERLPPSQA